MEAERPVDLAIGVFDGVHRGHQYLIQQMLARSSEEGHVSACLTFDPDPEVVLHPERSARALSTVAERVERLGALGVGQVGVLPFTRDLARQSAVEFVTGLQSAYALHALWAGSDFALGRDRQGTIEALQEIGKDQGFAVCAVEPLLQAGRPISSTWIRELLRDGDVRSAADLLGRPYSLQGPVVEGARRGRDLGFPTANLRPSLERALPADGVYAVAVRVNGSARNGVANLGSRPTFQEGERLLETHLFDFEGDLYGADMEVAFLERLRGVQRFESIADLQKQIQEDAHTARELLAREQREPV